MTNNVSAIKFGTDGWRAVVGQDFNFENVETVTKAIAQYILEKDGVEKPVIIGYDPRNMAYEFAQFSAKLPCLIRLCPHLYLRTMQKYWTLTR